MGLNEDINKIEQEVEALSDELEEEIKDFLDREIVTPSWKEVQKKKNLYQGYRKVTQQNNELNKLLMKIGDSIIALKELKNSLKINDDMPPQLFKKVKRRLDDNINQLYQYKDVMESEKDSLDQTLRFYNSAQYILGSPRMSGIE